MIILVFLPYLHLAKNNSCAVLGHNTIFTPPKHCQPPTVIMGILGELLGPVSNRLSNLSTGVAIVSTLFSFTVLAIVLNVLRQLLFKNPKEPPVVFHWVPFIGSTITYGIDPYKFFFSCREKVRFINNQKTCWKSL